MTDFRVDPDLLAKAAGSMIAQEKPLTAASTALTTYPNAGESSRIVADVLNRLSADLAAAAKASRSLGDQVISAATTYAGIDEAGARTMTTSAVALG